MKRKFNWQIFWEAFWHTFSHPKWLFLIIPVAIYLLVRAVA